MQLIPKFGFAAVRRLRVLFTHVALILVCIILVSPFVWMVSSSFKGLGDIMSIPPRIIPQEPTLDNYDMVFEETSFVNALFNSLQVAFATVIFSMIIATFSAYALSRFRFKGNVTLSICIIAAQMIPSVSRIIPLFVVFQTYGLLNNLLGVITAYTTAALPFCTWMLKGYFDSIPIELEQAAMVDGCTEIQAMRRVLLPVAAPAIATVALFAFIVAWNELLMARALLKSERLYTLSVHLSNFATDELTNWGMLMAYSAMVTIPSLIFFTYLQRQIISGLTGGAVKG